MGKKLGGDDDPLLVSVRSGAKFSMPGMMNTILNLGLNDKSDEGLAEKPAIRASPTIGIGASFRCSAKWRCTSTWRSSTTSSTREKPRSRPSWIRT